MRVQIGIACALTLLSAAMSSGQTPASRPTAADDVLVRKGLSKLGVTWLLQEDISLSEGLRVVRAAKAQLDENTSRRQKIERQIKSTKNAVFQWSAQYEEAHRRMDATKKDDVRTYNQLVGLTNNLMNNIGQGRQMIVDQEKQLAELPDPRDRYILALLELSDKMEATSKTYAELAANPDVQQALSKLNETARVKMRLGPSAQFAQELPRIRKLREMVVSAPLKVTISGGTPHLPVTLNGRATEVMAVDSGAAAVCIGWDLAQKAGVSPGSDAPTVIAGLAGGQKAEAKIVVLKSVQIGPFVAHDVECFVFPESVKNVDALLGDSFLRHFVYRMDLEAGELHMSQLASSAAPVAVAKNAGPVKPVAAQPLPSQKPIAGGGWVVLFRSADPTQWNSAVNDFDMFAVPLDTVPAAGIRYLRMRVAGGDFVIIPMTSEELRKSVKHEKWGWEGRDYQANRAHHLGIYVTSLPRAQTGSIDITQVPGAGHTGYGFGNRVNKDDVQGYAWAGKSIERAPIEISVTSRDLTPAERQHLIGE